MLESVPPQQRAMKEQMMKKQMGNMMPDAAHTNILSWQTSYLDRVRIKYLNNDPFKFWAF
ncbi:hypothetical protein N9C83_04495 [Opitutales bacterium]|nr:hypothetical protein [Opitutales bacterium]